MRIEKANKDSFRKSVEKYKREAGNLFMRHPREDSNDNQPEEKSQLEAADFFACMPKLA